LVLVPKKYALKAMLARIARHRMAMRWGREISMAASRVGRKAL
jgi:hypothetical protein